MIVSRGFIDGTVITRGFGIHSTLDKIIAIFVSSRMYPFINIASRVFT